MLHGQWSMVRYILQWTFSQIMLAKSLHLPVIWHLFIPHFCRKNWGQTTGITFKILADINGVFRPPFLPALDRVQGLVLSLRNALIFVPFMDQCTSWLTLINMECLNNNEVLSQTSTEQISLQQTTSWISATSIIPRFQIFIIIFLVWETSINRAPPSRAKSEIYAKLLFEMQF